MEYKIRSRGTCKFCFENDETIDRCQLGCTLRDDILCCQEDNHEWDDKCDCPFNRHEKLIFYRE
jgi:hypothetical protein